MHNLEINHLIFVIKEIQRIGKKHFICNESYRNEKELFNLQCWALTCETFFQKKSGFGCIKTWVIQGITSLFTSNSLYKINIF